jgi:hypothetical protein
LNSLDSSLNACAALDVSQSEQGRPSLEATGDPSSIPLSRESSFAATLPSPNAIPTVPHKKVRLHEVQVRFVTPLRVSALPYITHTCLCTQGRFSVYEGNEDSLPAAPLAATALPPSAANARELESSISFVSQRASDDGGRR